MRTYQVKIKETLCMTVEVEKRSASRSDGAGSIQKRRIHPRCRAFNRGGVCHTGKRNPSM